MKKAVLIFLVLSLGFAMAQRDSLITTDSSQAKKANSLFEKGVKAAQKNKMNQAEKLFHQAIKEYPLIPGAYVELGRIEMARQNPQKAVEYYLQARETYLKLHDENVKNLARHQNASIDRAQAGQKQNIGGGYARKSVIRSRQERTQDNRDVVQDPREAEIPALLNLYLSGAYMRLGKLDEAEKEIRTGLEVDEKLAPLHFNLAIIYMARGQFEKAADEARLARKYGFKLPDKFVKDLEKQGNLKL